MPTPLRDAADPHRDPPPPAGAAEAASANEAVTLNDYLLRVQRVVRTVPAAWVRCEIQKIAARSGATDIELVETGEGGKILAKSRAVVWPGVWRRIAAAFAAHGLALEAGSRVLIHVRPRFRPGFGFDLEATDIDVNFALGDLAARLKKIREDLIAAGLFDRQRRLPPVTDFRRVCVVAPEGAAGRADFIRVTDPLHRRGLVDFLHVPAVFQSAQASKSIRDALRSVYRECRAGGFCAVALIRGGGASTDLAHLACPELATAVCHMPVPVLVGIGHEIDRGILDEVAHRSFPTPTAVAAHIREAVVSGAEAADRAIHAIRTGAAVAVAQAETLVARAEAEARDRSRRAMDAAAEALRETRRALDPDARRSLEDAARRLAERVREANRAADACREHAEAQVRGIRAGMAKAVQDRLRPAEDGLAVARHAVETAPVSGLRDAGAGVEGLLSSAVAQAHARLVEAQAFAEAQRAAALAGAREAIRTAEQGVASARDAAAALDPRRLLASGYAILRDAHGRPLTTTAALRAEPEVGAELADGTTTLRPASAGD